MIRKTIIAAALGLSVATAAAESLVILHTNDTHSQIDPSTDGLDLGGVARRKVLIDSVRSNADNVLLIDAGDVVQGTLFFNLYKGELEEKLMNALGYDMRILGNHEFDNGMQALADNLSGAEASLLASNYQMRGTPLEGLFRPYIIKETGGKRIAFMPVNLRPSGMISKPNFEGMGYVDAIETANKLAWYLKNIEQADAVVALTHIGYSPSQPPGDVTLVESSKDIDLVIGGHSHTYLNPDDPKSQPTRIRNAEGREILVAQAGKGGRYLGEITIDLDQPEFTATSRLIPVDSHLDSAIDGSIEEIIAPYRAEVDALNHKKVAKSSRYLDKDGDALLNFAADFVATRGRQLAKDVDFAIVNKGGLRNSLPKGDVTEGDLITLMPFFNRVQVIDIRGDKLLEAFDVMARIGGNGVSSEVEAVYDPATGKCAAATVNGKPIESDRTYRVASIDYLIEGGDYMTPLTESVLVAQSENIMFEDLLDYFKKGPGKGKKINPYDRPRWKALN